MQSDYLGGSPYLDYDMNPYATQELLAARNTRRNQPNPYRNYTTKAEASLTEGLRRAQERRDAEQAKTGELYRHTNEPTDSSPYAAMTTEPNKMTDHADNMLDEYDAQPHSLFYTDAGGRGSDVTDMAGGRRSNYKSQGKQELTDGVPMLDSTLIQGAKNTESPFRSYAPDRAASNKARQEMDDYEKSWNSSFGSRAAGAFRGVPEERERQYARLQWKYQEARRREDEDYSRSLPPSAPYQHVQLGNGDISIIDPITGKEVNRIKGEPKSTPHYETGRMGDRNVKFSVQNGMATPVIREHTRDDMGATQGPPSPYGTPLEVPETAAQMREDRPWRGTLSPDQQLLEVGPDGNPKVLARGGQKTSAPTAAKPEDLVIPNQELKQIQEEIKQANKGIVANGGLANSRNAAIGVYRKHGVDLDLFNREGVVRRKKGFKSGMDDVEQQPAAPETRVKKYSLADMEQKAAELEALGNPGN